MGFLYQIDTSHKGIRNESLCKFSEGRFAVNFLPSQSLTRHVIASERRSGKFARDDELTHVMLLGLVEKRQSTSTSHRCHGSDAKNFFNSSPHSILKSDPELKSTARQAGRITMKLLSKEEEEAHYK